MAARCLRCQRFKANDGLLLCCGCGPPDKVRQDATVCPQTIRVTVALNGSPPAASPADQPAGGLMRAKVGVGKSKLVAKIEYAAVARDRRSFETRELVTDSTKNFYRQEWTDPETGETTFRKVGLLSDRTMHGRASYKPTSPRGASGSPTDTVAQAAERNDYSVTSAKNAPEVAPAATPIW